MKSKIYLSITILIVAVAALLMYQYHRPIAIEQTYQGIVYDADLNFIAPDTVYFKGERSRFLFAKDSIKGTLTSGERTYDVLLKENRASYFAILTELKGSSVTSLGTMYLATDFKHVWLQLKDFRERYPVEHGYFVNGAATIEEAQDIAKNLLEEPNK
ncbi:hypothetical protein D3P09_21840 [Paenibacillus pinisoli]|uniref:Uncharacterized protein n=1 Tax=Paenibacillus pinisoli TaxID=1276110 RepID=A0A3A6PME5_9BACL|nr:hypothetical protein [Paenibacillus pinisoli]RJX37621.1 hypothetical protein D3P09_21840 [Paenibacillus pinisoli]